MKLPQPPRDILLIKSHSMGIGDLLRSSAAWASLKARWPQSNLHLLMLSNHEGYPSEAFIRSHHLLQSAHFVTIKSGDPVGGNQKKLPMDEIFQMAERALEHQPIDLVIDFEPGGLRTPWLTRRIAKRKQAFSVGIAQFPLRRFFYDGAAPSSRTYQRLHGLSRDMDYTEKDYVALAALGIVRGETRIALKPSAAALAWQTGHPLPVPEGRIRLVLNIGCGTLDALPKRPDLSHLADCMVALLQRSPYQLHLSGAAFEAQVNAEFTTLMRARLHAAGLDCEITDHAGQLSLEQLTALLACAQLVVSSDSGPYHMAVALQIPTLCWFNFETPPSRHRHADVRCLVRPDVGGFVDACLGLVSCNSGG